MKELALESIQKTEQENFNPCKIATIEYLEEIDPDLLS